MLMKTVTMKPGAMGKNCVFRSDWGHAINECVVQCGLTIVLLCSGSEMKDLEKSMQGVWHSSGPFCAISFASVSLYSDTQQRRTQ